MLTHARLHELLDYDRTSGIFRWRAPAGRWGRIAAGSVAGATNSRGYICIKLDGQRYAAHRLAWLYVHGEWPSRFIDHVNGNPSDNMIENLREATDAENQWNRKVSRVSPTGLKGIRLHRSSGLWHARIKTNGREESLGYFDTAEDAHAAYAEAARRRHGEFARTL